MENTSLVALSRQTTLRRQMDVVANNIANMNTTGFKGEKMMFTEHMVKSRGGETIFGDNISFVRDVATMRDTSEGPMEATSNPLDLAIGGEGYFVIGTDKGNRYTRNGHLKLDEAGQLVTQAGDPVLSDNEEPFFFSTQDIEISISRDGTISTENGDLGRIRVVRFDNEQQLRAVSSGLYATEDPPQDMETPQVVQNMLEKSNVQPILEITKMIEVNRSYASLQKFIDQENERVKKMSDEFARVA